LHEYRSRARFERETEVYWVMNRADFSIALIVLSMVAAGCEKGSTAVSVPAPKTSLDALARSAPVTDAQRQYLSIEAVAVSEAVDVLELPGRLTFRPQAQSTVGATTAGRVVAVLVQAGQVVKAGTELLTIESAEAGTARATLDQAATRLASAESVFRRQVEMVEKGVGLEFERQEAEARLKEARAEYERARNAADLIGSGQGIRVSVRAPADGVVITIRTAVGASIAPGGEALLELGDPTRLQVVAQVPEGDLRRIAVGQEADVVLPALAAHVAARVENFNPRVDPETRRAQVYLALAKRIGGLRAGMLAQVALRAGAKAGISVPVSAVLIKDGKRRVVYVERSDGAFESREVQTGQNRDGRVVILQGLTAGERVVVRGALLLDTQAEQLL
jgi:cobalt-zinc-cadmium efflux system membrane fusion protein